MGLPILLSSTPEKNMSPCYKKLQTGIDCNESNCSGWLSVEFSQPLDEAKLEELYEIVTTKVNTYREVYARPRLKINLTRTIIPRKFFSVCISDTGSGCSLSISTLIREYISTIENIK